MADNVTVDNGALTDFTVAARDSAGVYYHRHELVSFASVENGAEVSVTTAATTLLAANADRVGLEIENRSGVTIRWGTTGVTYTTGGTPDVGERIYLTDNAGTVNAILAITSSGSSTVYAREITRGR